jgi:chromatin segregation and condensation protein Rec8/ScpA/Scc1 (kleisin family)
VVFQKLFEGARVLAVVVTFLALLELIRRNLVVARQSANFAEIRIAKAVKDE